MDIFTDTYMFVLVFDHRIDHFVLIDLLRA